MFLTDRRAPARTPACDVCPVTGRARLSYRRAAELFDTLTRPLAHPDVPAEHLQAHPERYAAWTPSPTT
ncbi:hypothetical protein SMC26_43785 [Actinomadura fulvescens]|uniref:Uncharacterized protein n=1 Tax=Actinomadura fulvescens TaxID=46160 RepID=A0ABP6DCI6_9ACTN